MAAGVCECSKIGGGGDFAWGGWSEEIEVSRALLLEIRRGGAVVMIGGVGGRGLAEAGSRGNWEGGRVCLDGC